MLKRPRWHKHRPPVPISGPPSTVRWPWLVSPMSRANRLGCTLSRPSPLLRRQVQQLDASWASGIEVSRIPVSPHLREAAWWTTGLAKSTRPRCDCPMRAGLSKMCRLGRLGSLASRCWVENFGASISQSLRIRISGDPCGSVCRAICPPAVVRRTVAPSLASAWRPTRQTTAQATPRGCRGSVVRGRDLLPMESGERLGSEGKWETAWRGGDGWGVCAGERCRQ